MYCKKIFAGFLILSFISALAGANTIDQKKENKIGSSDSIKLGINFLKKYMNASDVWQPENPEIQKVVNGLIHFAEDEPIDSILVKLGKFQKNGDLRYIRRSPLQVGDSLQLAGYQSWKGIQEKMKQLDRAIWNGVDLKTIPLPASLVTGSDHQLHPIAPNDEKAILERTGIILPDSLKNMNAVTDSMMHTANDFNRIRSRDQQRTQLLESTRLKYNTLIQKLNLDSAITAYQQYAVRVFSDSLQNHLRDSLKLTNEQILVHYNDSVVRSVNDSINRFVKALKRVAQNDSVPIWVYSLSGKPTQVWLRNNQRSINRMFIKNVQNDSIGIQLMNIDKHTLGIAIEDNVTFTRIAQKQRRNFAFEKFNPDTKLTKITKKFVIVTPWEMGGFGTFGFSQTYLNNWKAGGMSAFSFLSVLKGFANYSDHNIKWENSGELRNGWIRQGGSIRQTQKNDDKLELISRLGVSAFKKWYYSCEIDFVTQLFNGYNYPDNLIPISSYLSPATTFFKLGFDYKPNNNFSLLLSPITVKNVFVRDTAKVDQTRYGISATRRSFWEPGLNADVRYKIDFTPRISYETKYKMFINYQNPFKKFDVNWENTVVAQLTNRINMSFMLNMLYDDNVTFPTGRMDAHGVEIFKPKMQTKELTTIGLSYKINKHVYKRRKAV